MSQVIVIAWFALVLAVPLVAILAGSDGAARLTDPDVLAAAGFSAWQATLSASVATLGGAALGLAVGARGGRWRRVCETLLALPYGVPTVTVAATLVLWLGKAGPLAALDWSYTWKAVVLAHVMLNLPWVALRTSQARALVPEAEFEAARTLGAGPFEIFRVVVWPRVSRPIAAAAAQVFNLCLTSFALVLLLGGGPPVESLETAIVAQVRLGGLDLGGASAAAAWEFVLALVPWAAGILLSRQVKPSRVIEASRRASGGREAPWVFVCALFVVPYLWVLKSPAGALQSQEARVALLTSFQLAAAATAFALTVGFAGVLALRRFAARPFAVFLELVLYFPSSVSILVLGLGFWLAYSRWVDPFEGSFAAIAILQGTVAVPWVVRTIWPVAESRPMRALEAARLLGATRWRAFLTVEWPRLSGPVVAAAAGAAGASLGEVAAVSLFYSENLVPLPLLTSRWLGQYRFEDAQSLSSLLFVAATGLVAIAFALRRNAT